ncbi:hypothetical protein [Winogradskyella thalassocola]|uniref:Fibronectin type-III domain-containing protein n=1 Tax=Winogradskyella thalassocola TaxID=262004 RepID=A0A1G7ZAP1_9FLAO|nr:hypothetical protein [Winogradskyella thalassocola]SDH05689.1 hypothetical protein SAMN04489796_1011277 [Winogradskyella thalassocola]
MKIFTSILLIGVTLLLFNCNADDDQSKENRNPSAFIVTEGAATNTGIPFNWTAAVDPDNDTIVYAVYSNGDLLIEDLNALTYVIEYNLFLSGHNTILVSASDGFGGVAEQELVVNLLS